MAATLAWLSFRNMEMFGQVLMHICLGGLAAIGVGIFLWKVAVPAWEAIMSIMPRSRFQQILLAVFAIGMIQYGATKGGWQISFDGGIKQNPIQPSVVTNNLVEIHWTRDTSQGVYVPETATVYIDYKEWANTNATWQSLAQTTVGAWGYSTMLPNATNYSYNVWAYYIPPEPVHTNGVWLYKTMKDRHQGNPIPLRARIEINGKAIATPKEKRKDEAE